MLTVLTSTPSTKYSSTCDTGTSWQLEYSTEAV